MGFVARTQGQADHEVLRLGLEALANHAHRGAVAADGKTGDGAGVMTQLPQRFFSRVYRQLTAGVLPGPGDVAVAVVFLPLQDAPGRSLARRTLEDALRHFGMEPLAWRELPLSLEALGEKALFARPHIQQLFVDRNRGRGLRSAALPGPAPGRAPGPRKRHRSVLRGLDLSSKTVVYKGLCMADQLGSSTRTCARPTSRLPSACSTSATAPTPHSRWELAHPFRMIAHNGEFNTLRGNHNWMRARETALGRAGIDPNVFDLTPVIEPDVSDSGAFDNVLSSSCSPARAVALVADDDSGDLGEPARAQDMPAGWRDLTATFSCLMEPWDGPAAVAFFDGERVGAMLDPQRPAPDALHRPCAGAW